MTSKDVEQDGRCRHRLKAFNLIEVKPGVLVHI